MGAMAPAIPTLTTMPEPQYVMSTEGFRLATYTWGDEDAPVVLCVHGFASSCRDNFVNTGWVRDLTRAGYRVIGVDQRGHGQSEKPHEAAAYSIDALVHDLVIVLDTYLVDTVRYSGYSLGARVGWQFAVQHPEHVERAVLGGIPDGKPLARLKLDEARAFVDEGVPVEDRVTRNYVTLADRVPGNDLRALVALAEGMRLGEGDPDPSNAPPQPVLFATGSEDAILEQSRALAAATPGGRFVELPGRHHFNAPGSREFRQAALAFFGEEPAADIRLGTIGTSMITGKLADAVDAVDGIRLGTVFSRDADTAAEKAREFGADDSTDSFDTLLTSDDVDAIYVASPNSEHGAQARAALEAGRHVLVEKPAVTSTAEWDELVALADARGLIVLEALRTLYDPGTAAVRELLPEIGTVRQASLRYQSRSSRYDKVLAGERVNMFDPAMAGGALNDLGVYCTHAMVALFGEPDEVAAYTLGLWTGVDGAGSVIARYPEAVVTLEFSKMTSTRLPSEIQGEDGTLVIDDIAGPRRITLARRNGEVTERIVDLPELDLSPEVRRFVQLIRSGAGAADDQALTRKTLRTLERIRDAAAR